MRDLTIRSRVLLLVTAITALAIFYSFNPIVGQVMTMQTTNAQTVRMRWRPRIRCSRNGKVRMVACRRLITCRSLSSSPRSKPRWLRTLPRSTRSRRIRPRQLLRTPSWRWNGPGSTLDRVHDDLRSLGFDHERSGVSGRAARDGAAAGRLQRSDHAERSALQTHRSRLQLAREGEANAGTAAPDLALLHQLRARRRALDAEAKARLSQINQQLAGLFTKFSQNVLAEEDRSVHRSEERS